MSPRGDKDPKGSQEAGRDSGPSGGWVRKVLFHTADPCWSLELSRLHERGVRTWSWEKLGGSQAKHQQGLAQWKVAEMQTGKDTGAPVT